jgi:predicted secreted protein
VALLGVVALVGVAGCGGSDGSSGGSTGGSAKVYGPGDSISVEAGDTFVIALSANPTTGYSWSAAANPNARYDSSKQVTSSTLPGAGGTQQLTFTATAAGTSILVLSYARPFEPGVPPVQTESFPLTVK